MIADQVRSLTDNAPHWLDQLQRNRQVQRLDDEYDIIAEDPGLRHQAATSPAPSSAARWVSGLAVLGALFNGFIVIVLTLYFLASLRTTTSALYRLAPASRRDRVTRLGDRVVRSVGGYVSGAFIVAMCAGISLADLPRSSSASASTPWRSPSSSALLDVIPMIGATLGAVIVTAIGFAEDWKIGAGLRDLLHRLPAGRELRDLPAGDVEVGRRPRRGHRHRRPRSAPRSSASSARCSRSRPPPRS